MTRIESSSSPSSSPSTSSSRIRSEVRDVSETVQESTLIIDPLTRDDNATYVCRARNEYNNESYSNIHLLVQHAPDVRLDTIDCPSPRSAIIHWTVQDDGWAPLKTLILQIKNYSDPDSEWTELQSSSLLLSSQSSSSSLTSSTASLKSLPSRGSFVVSYLTPGVTYGFQLSAVNDVGQSDWVTMNVTTPVDVPSTVSEIHVLAKTNETLLIGWKRPGQENGSLITQYQMHLKNDRKQLISDQSMEVEVNSGGKLRNNYMYIFVNLQPGSVYYFQVRGCSLIGCGNWSEPPLEAVTADGHADPPTSVTAICSFDHVQGSNIIHVNWKLPENPRGKVVGFNVTLQGHAVFKNEMNIESLDQFKDWQIVQGNDSREFKGQLRPNTNYTVRVCTMNRSGCGSLSLITTQSMCTTYPSLPPSLPSSQDLKLSLTHPWDPSCRKIRASFPRISERNGAINCYRLVMIRLPRESSQTSSPAPSSSFSSSSRMISSDVILAKNPVYVNITSYEEVHRDILSSTTSSIFSESQASTSGGAFIAEEFPPTDFTGDVIIGDDNFSRCPPLIPEGSFSSSPSSTSYFLEEETGMPRRIKSPAEIPETIIDASSPYASFSATTLTATSVKGKNQHLERQPLPRVKDGILAPSTNYTGFLEVRVLGANGKVLTARSDYFQPVMTGLFVTPAPASNFSESPFAPILSSMTESANAVVLGVVSGLALVFLLLIFVLCFLKRKVAESTTESDTQSDDNHQDHHQTEEVEVTRTLKSVLKTHIPVDDSEESLSNEMTRLSPTPNGMTDVNNISLFTANQVSSVNNHHICSSGTPELMMPQFSNPCGHHESWVGQPLYFPHLPLAFLEGQGDGSLLFQTDFNSLPHQHFSDANAMTNNANTVLTTFSQDCDPAVLASLLSQNCQDCNDCNGTSFAVLTSFDGGGGGNNIQQQEQQRQLEDVEL